MLKMQFINLRAPTYLTLLFFVFSACTNRLSEVSLFSNLQEGDSVSVALYSTFEEQYITVNGVTVNSADVMRGRVDISLPDSIYPKNPAMLFTVACYSDSIFSISSIKLKNIGIADPQKIANSLWWQEGLMFEIDHTSKTLSSPITKDIFGTFSISVTVFFDQLKPVGIHFVYRILLIIFSIIIIFVFCRKAATQRFVVFAIAFFLASLPLVIGYTNYVMAFMIISMVVSFLYNKPYRFNWQPVFYLLCALYLMLAIGLIYTVDFWDQGIKHLDKTVILVLFPIIFCMYEFSNKNIVLLLRCFMWLVIAFCVFGLLSYFYFVPELTLSKAILNSKSYAPPLMTWPAYWHPSFNSTMLLMAVPSALYLRFQGEKHITSLEMIAGVLLPVVFTILSGARIGIVIIPVLFGLAYFFYCKFKPALKWGLVAAGIIAVGAILYIFPEADDNFSDHNRANLRKTAISAIKEKPVLGWGTGSGRYLISCEQRANSIGLETPMHFRAFHNQYLESWAQQGILGILILLTLIGWMLWIGISEKKYLLLALIAIYGLFFLTESALYVSKGVVPFAFWVCFLISNRENM